MAEDPRITDFYTRLAEREVAREIERAEHLVALVSSARLLSVDVEPGIKQVVTFARSLESVLPNQENLRVLLALLFLGVDEVA